MASHKPLFNAYIDESGDEGFRFPTTLGLPGSSSWFILAAAIVPAEADTAVAAVINRIKSRLWPTLSAQYSRPLHWTRLKHPQRKVVAQEIAQENVTAIAVAFQKDHPKLDRTRFDPRIVRASSPKLKFALYYYASRLLAERVCKFAARHGRQVDLIFETRAQLSVKDMQSYLSLIATLPGPYGTPTIPSGSLHNIDAQGKQALKMLQVADAFAGSLSNALEFDRYGNTEPTYVQTLGQRFDRKDGVLWGHGIKLFPGTKDERVTAVPAYAWMSSI